MKVTSERKIGAKTPCLLTRPRLTGNSGGRSIYPSPGSRSRASPPLLEATAELPDPELLPSEPEAPERSPTACGIEGNRAQAPGPFGPNWQDSKRAGSGLAS